MAHQNQCDQCEERRTILLRPPTGGAAGRDSLRSARFDLKKAHGAKIPGVLRQYARLQATSRLAGLYRTLVVRSRQLLSESSTWVSGLSPLALRSGGQIRGRGTSAWAYIERRLIKERDAQIKCCGDLIRRHREEHAETLLKAAVGMALGGATLDQVLQRFLRRE